MSPLCVFILIACANTAYVAAKNVSSVAYTEYGIVPDVVPVIPTEYLNVEYPSGVEVQEGNVLTPTEVKDIPSLSWNASSDQYYTIALVDPDAPSRAEPTSREWLHWLIVNVLGTDIDSGETIAEYIGSGPAQFTHFHRYFFAVYEQPGGPLEFDELILTNRSADNRELFSISDFAVKYNFSSLYAGNFYQAEYDDYVPTLYEQLGL